MLRRGFYNCMDMSERSDTMEIWRKGTGVWPGMQGAWPDVHNLLRSQESKSTSEKGFISHHKYSEALVYFTVAVMVKAG